MNSRGSGKHFLEREARVLRAESLKFGIVLVNLIEIFCNLLFDSCGFVIEQTILGSASPLVEKFDTRSMEVIEILVEVCSVTIECLALSL